jgi:hypothetical protein
MNLSPILLQMKSAKKTTVQLHSYDFQTADTWHCSVEGQADGIAYKILGAGETPAKAVEDAHGKWLRVTGQLPELVGALPPPDPSTYVDVESTPVDDEIPF